MAKKTNARSMAEFLEDQQMHPSETALNKMLEFYRLNKKGFKGGDRDYEKAEELVNDLRYRDELNPPRKPRTEEQMSELTREVSRFGSKPGGMKKGGVVSSASKRADGIAIKGKTRGRMV